MLNLQGNKNVAAFTGYTRINLNSASRFRPIKKPAVEVAALNYVSNLFYNNREHAGSVRLYEENYKKKPKLNTKRLVEAAYRSYRKWFEKVKEIGIGKAREQKIDPLDGSGISWS